MFSQVIIGYGEIGKAVHAVVGESGIVDIHRREDVPENVEVMHVCIPYTDEFEESVHAYIKELSPQHTVIWSTVPVGTTERFGLFAVHSPVEGVHPHLENSIRLMERWVGVLIRGEAQYFTAYFQALGLRVRIAGSPKFTEALKLLSTTEYGVNLVFADYKAYVAEKIGMDFELTKEWNRAYNRLYKDLGMDKRYQKYVLDAPGGRIGGHCVRENSKLLNKQFPDELVKRIGDMQ